MTDDRGSQPDVGAVLHHLGQLRVDGGLASTDVTGIQAIHPPKTIGDHENRVQIIEHQVRLVGVVAELASLVTRASILAQKQPSTTRGAVMGSIDRP